MKTEIYVRHRATCKKVGDRQAFDGCPIYARYTCRDLHSGQVLEEFHGSLKGFSNKTAATEYIENRFMMLRNGAVKAAKKRRTPDEVVELYIADKRRELGQMPMGIVSDHMRRAFKRFGKEVPTEREHESVIKLKKLLGRFVEFCGDQKLLSIVDVQYEHLISFLNIRNGRIVSIVKDGEIVDRITRPPALKTHQIHQSLLKGFFLWLQNHKMIEDNPALLLRPIKSPKLKTEPTEQKDVPWTPGLIFKVLDTMQEIYERPQRLIGFFKILVYASPRIADIVSMEVSHLDDEGITYWNNKSGSWCYAKLPPSLIRHLRTGFKPKSEKYFFWSGNGEAKSKANYYSGKLLRAFRAAGLPEKWEGGPRSHEFRDTTGTMLMEQPGGRLEDAQLALNHSKRTTTELHYVVKTKTRYEQVNEKKKEMWEKEGMWE
jgi:integrase